MQKLLQNNRETFRAYHNRSSSRHHKRCQAHADYMDVNHITFAAKVVRPYPNVDENKPSKCQYCAVKLFQLIFTPLTLGLVVVIILKQFRVGYWVSIICFLDDKWH